MTVFAVLAHGAPSTFTALVDWLAPSEVLVHVDSKTNIDLYPRRPNVTYVADRANVHWGGFSVVDATLRLYTEAMTRVSRPDEYVVLLSGQCVPVRPLDSLEEQFARHKGVEYCKAGALLDGNPHNERRVLRRWFFDALDARTSNGHRRLNAAVRRAAMYLAPRRSRSDFGSLTVAAGSQWTALTAACLSDILSRTALVAEARKLLSTALAPDEIFFHSLVHSTEWASATLTPKLDPKGDHPTAHYANLHQIDVSLTRYMTPHDLTSAATDGAFFARKVQDANEPSVAATIGSLLTHDEFRKFT